MAATNVIISLQNLVSREADPRVSKLQGGAAFNVIPDYVIIDGTFRALSRETLKHLKQRIEQVIIGQAAVQRCNANVNFHDEEKPLYPPTINNDDLHKFFVDTWPLKTLLGMKNASFEPVAPLHSPYLVINEDGLPYGAALHASLATSYLTNYQQDIARSHCSLISCNINLICESIVYSFNCCMV
ncbi:hypothetical protein JHK82_017239 [Glycine max]|uniref:Peptidase M20 dimerisation domain-containing protein n=2 Tax=Glycine subgen. Soja TaxID=1462606 RepID=K7KZ00_SOYBN|nr:hypothetical protein JHK87_017180 [Glycine soja]KAG5021337.1 hypothetical protein JHK85_017679 [Glycine max]KAG5036449.1 hypothetical protein JHK86_017289 [Glycine max]KAG5141544.1 hypothetical protein JHK82_017239 [Glycine max]RZC00823.1 IAA-amino acid hydrolase ILR1-like 1 [Glycine soja]